MSVTDDELQELLGRALRAAEPVPDKVIDGARAPWTWRTIDEELAELVFDSATELTGVRSEDTARQLTFRAPGVEIEVMVVDDGARRIVGQLIPPGEFTVQLTTEDAVRDSETDRPGPVHVRAGAPGPGADHGPRRRRRPVASTEWTIV